jgi:hypothetical protein
MARMVELVVAIGVDGARDAVAEIQKLEGAVVKSVKVTENLGQASSTAGKQTTDALGIAGTSAYKFGQQWQQVMSSIGTATVAATAVIGGIKTAISWAEEGAQIEYASSKFDRLANSIGTTGDALRKDLVVASRGVKSNLELTAMASEVMSLKLAKNHDDVVRLANVASALNMNMNQLTLSLANQSTMRLDQLGLSVEAVTTKMEALKATGMDEGTAYFEAFISAAEEAIKVQGHVADSALGNFERLKAATSDYFTLLKTEFAEDSPISKWAGGLADMVQKATGDIENKKIIEMGVEMGAISGLEGWNALVGTPYQRELVAKFVQEYIADASNAAAKTKDWGKASEQLFEGMSTDLATEALKDFAAQYEQLTSLSTNFGSVIKLATQYDSILTDIGDANARIKELEPFKETGGVIDGVWMSAKKVNEEIGKFGEVVIKGEAAMKRMANQMTLDMLQATIAIGGVTKAEAEAYFKMAEEMGIISAKAAEAAISAYKNAVDTINGMHIDPITGEIRANADPFWATVAEIMNEKRRKVIIDIIANTKPFEKGATVIEQIEWLRKEIEVGIDKGAWDEDFDIVQGARFFAKEVGIDLDLPGIFSKLREINSWQFESKRIPYFFEYGGIIGPPKPEGPGPSWPTPNFPGGASVRDKAIGGPVYPGKSYLWQEPGREGELLIPEKYGRVMSNVEVAQAMRDALIMNASANSGQGNTTTTNSNNVTYNVHATYKEEPVLTLSEHLRIMATLEGRA